MVRLRFLRFSPPFYVMLLTWQPRRNVRQKVFGMSLFRWISWCRGKRISAVIKRRLVCGLFLSLVSAASDFNHALQWRTNRVHDISGPIVVKNYKTVQSSKSKVHVSSAWLGLWTGLTIEVNSSNFKKSLRTFTALVGQSSEKFSSFALHMAIDFRSTIRLFYQRWADAPRISCDKTPRSGFGKTSGAFATVCAFSAKTACQCGFAKRRTNSWRKSFTIWIFGADGTRTNGKLPAGRAAYGTLGESFPARREWFYSRHSPRKFGQGRTSGSICSARSEEGRRRGKEEIFSQNDFDSLFESLDIFYLEKEVEKQFQARAKSAESKLKQEITKREKLVKKLNQDLANHGDASGWKRFGDLILANLADAVRIDDKVLVVDYYDENTPTIEIEANENDSLTETAEKFFRRYTRRETHARKFQASEITQKDSKRLFLQKRGSTRQLPTEMINYWRVCRWKTRETANKT